MIVERRPAGALLAAAAFAALTFVAVQHWREQPPPAPPPIRLALPSPTGVESGWGDETVDAAISPDESEIVFVASRDGAQQLWRRSLRDEAATPLEGTDGAQYPAWKQTGRVVAFFSAGRLKQLTLSDGRIHDLAAARGPAGASWRRDGALLYASGASGPIQRLSYGRVAPATTLADGDVGHVFPAAIAGSDDFVYVAVRDNGRRVVRLSSAGRDRDLITTSGHAVMVGDHLLHVRDGVLLAYARDRESGALAARGTPLGLAAGVAASGRGLFAASPRVLVYASAFTQAREVAWLDMAGARLGTMADAGDYWQVRLSADDRFAALTAMDPLLRALDIVVVGAADSAPRKLTRALAADTDPVWSPDGTRVLFRSLQGGRPDLAITSADATAGSDSTLRSDFDETPTDWSGNEVLFHARGSGSTDILRLRLAEGTYAAVADTPFNESDARWSPDRQWIAYVSDESGRPDIYARRDDGTRVRVSFGGGTRPRWTSDGRAIVFLRDGQVMRADLVSGGFTAARVLFASPGIRDFDVAHRGDRLLALLPAGSSQRPQVSAVLNWTSAIGGQPAAAPAPDESSPGAFPLAPRQSP